MWDVLLSRFNYLIYILLMMIGLYAMVSKNNMLKKLIGMSIFQTAIMLFYVSIGAKRNATIPILTEKDYHALKEASHQGAEAAGHGADAAGNAAQHALQAGQALAEAGHGALDPSHYINPLPHVLMLTAIVVGVATLGVAMAVLQKIHAEYGTIEEDEIMERVRL